MSQNTIKDSFTSHARLTKHAAPVSQNNYSALRASTSPPLKNPTNFKSGSLSSSAHQQFNSTSNSRTTIDTRVESPSESSSTPSKRSALGTHVIGVGANQDLNQKDIRYESPQGKENTWLEDEADSDSGDEDDGEEENDLKVSRTRLHTVDIAKPASDKPVSTHPESPKSTASAAAKDSTEFTMPRTSSIDSAISSVSNSSWPQKTTTEVKEPSLPEIRSLIATAGSAENLVQHLLRDKTHAAVQNAQLWRLVDKQRALLLGLNKDLERLTKERDRYRKKAKDAQTQPFAGLTDRERTDSHSPRAKEFDLPVPEAEPVPDKVLAESITLDQDNIQVFDQGDTTHTEHSSPDPGMMPSPLHLQQMQQHQHPSIFPIIQESLVSSPENQQSPKQTSMPSGIVTNLPPPTFALTEATPVHDKQSKSFPANRKAPPKPLDLKLSSQEGVSSHSAKTGASMDGAVDNSSPQSAQRGRKKTREEDDQERETALMLEQEARSRSKKEKRSKSASLAKDEPSGTTLASSTGNRPVTPQQQAIPPQDGSLMPTVNPGVNANPTGSIIAQTLSPPLRSPGLPSSPRPADRTLASPMPGFNKEGHQIVNSLPMSPRTLGGSFPLSPRAPKQPLPAPTNPTIGAAAAITQIQQMSQKQEADRPRPHESKMSTGDIPPVYRGFVTSTYPDLLLPPNALPSIQVKVASSRLRPSRNSIIGFRTLEENTVFSLSVFSRSNSTELWRIEKVPVALPQLEQQLRPRCRELPKLPDRKLFSGHSPAMLDARRSAIDSYFDELLDTPVDEEAAVLICRFLSTDVLEPPPDRPESHGQAAKLHGSTQPGGSSLPKKVGYLTKKGKNFGGWKSRYFVLDSPELRYFEAPGGAHLGTIRLLNARIGRQTPNEPAGHDDADVESQFRHAFLILEPKRKDSNSHVRHVLCAENDAERDEWVETLLHYIDGKPETSPKTSTLHAHNTDHGFINSDPRAFSKAHQQADLTIESTMKTSSPKFGPGVSSSPSPSSTSSTAAEALIQDNTHGPRQMNISGPMHATPIPDAATWGNKSNNQAPVKDRDQWKRNLFHFKKSSNEQLQQNHQAVDERSKHTTTGPALKATSHVRPVFGMQLAEAVEHCAPEGVNVYLPAVVYRCIEYLRVKKASNEEGLFRLSGSNVLVRTLKERFNTEGDIDLLAEGENYDVHAIASLFKTYLRELPSTILTRDLHIEFLKVLELDDKSKKIAMFHGLVHKLPKVNYALLRTLSQYLLEVVQNSDRNKMSVKNVGIVFSPTLNIPAPVFSMFLTEFEAIFEDQHRPESAIRTTDVQPAGSLTPEDIRSPRHQMFSDLPTPAYDQTKFSRNGVGIGNTMSRDEQATNHELDQSREFGFAPLQPAYETRNYVSIPQQSAVSQHRFPNAHNAPTQATYRVVAPDNASSIKAKRRESSMLLFN